MVKGIVIFGGIWAATATSVALVRQPHSGETLEDGEVETLNPSEFTPKGNEIPFANKYPSYFVATTKANKKFWENRFNEKRGGNATIKPNSRFVQPALEIVSGWDDPKEQQEGKYSLVGFCRKGYSTKADFYDKRTWDFDISKGVLWFPRTEDFWSLCSVFDSKPKTLYEHFFSGNSFESKYSENQMGKKLHERLVRDDDHQAFWNVREQEWKNKDVKDSAYFGNDKKKNHTIKELCEKAYSKEVSEEDNSNTPSSGTITKYCGLEWSWD